jgi:hypothetical protein
MVQPIQKREIMSNETKVTAVEWLVEEANLLENNGWILNLIDQAKAMEKEQIIDAFDEGYFDDKTPEQYYTDTYKP